jgi:hypothetical protein
MKSLSNGRENFRRLGFSAVGRVLGPGAPHETRRATCHKHGRLLDLSGHEGSKRMVGKVDWPSYDQSPRANRPSHHELSLSKLLAK